MITRENGRGYHFGLEVEYLLVDAETFRPLWHPDLSFDGLNAAFEAIAVGDLPPLDGLDLEPPHRRLMPFAVEGYHVPAPELGPRDLLPKGVEIRTPVCPSIEACLECLHELHARGATEWVVQHAQAADDADHLVREGTAILGTAPLFCTQVGPVLGAHLGRGMLVGGLAAESVQRPPSFV